MKRIIPALLLAVCVLLSSVTACAPVQETDDSTEYSRRIAPLKELDHCVVEPDARQRMSDMDMLAFRELTEAMLARRDNVAVAPDTVTVEYLLDRLRRGPYYYFLSDATVGNGEVHFTYAYSPEKQQEMLSFIDGEMLRIVNYDFAETDNDLDIILKIYLAVTHAMTYDTERTDNKKLGSPLFEYPADEIYKALRDRKSLCYGFAYVMRYALLQRNIDCFCVYGLCTSRDDGHEWIVFRFDGAWFHCDPAWDRADDGYAKLIHFGKTDREREVDSLVTEDFASLHEAAYGTVECTDDRFSIFRKMRRFSYVGDHRFYMTDYANKEYIFDTESFSFVD